MFRDIIEQKKINNEPTILAERNPVHAADLGRLTAMQSRFNNNDRCRQIEYRSACKPAMCASKETNFALCFHFWTFRNRMNWRQMRICLVSPDCLSQTRTVEKRYTLQVCGRQFPTIYCRRLQVGQSSQPPQASRVIWSRRVYIKSANLLRFRVHSVSS